MNANEKRPTKETYIFEKRPAFVAGDNEEDDTFDMIVGALEDIMMDYEFQQMQVSFQICRSLLWVSFHMHSYTFDMIVGALEGIMMNDEFQHMQVSFQIYRSLLWVSFHMHSYTFDMNKCRSRVHIHTCTSLL